MFRFKDFGKEVYILDKNNIKLPKRISHKKFTFFIDEHDENTYECSNCSFKYIYTDHFIMYIKRFVNKFLIRYRRYDPRLLKSLFEYETLMDKLGIHNKLSKRYSKVLYEIVEDTFTYYLSKLEKYNFETILEKLFIFVYDIHIIYLILTHKRCIFVLDKEHIKNIEYIFGYFLRII